MNFARENIGDLISDGTAEARIRLFHSISALIILFLFGQLSGYSRQLFPDAILTQKKDGEIRPIVVGIKKKDVSSRK